MLNKWHGFCFVSQETAKLGRSDARWQATQPLSRQLWRSHHCGIKGLAEPCVESCLATLNTMDSKPYKNLLQDKLKEWYNLYAAVRPTPKAGRLSVASLGYGDDSADEDGAAARDEGEEGRIRGELPLL